MTTGRLAYSDFGPQWAAAERASGENGSMDFVPALLILEAGVVGLMGIVALLGIGHCRPMRKSDRS